jgi:F0F1-type ATP synthase assembly protein I
MRKVNSDFSIGEMEFVKKPRKGSKNTSSSFDPNLMNMGMYLSAPILLGLLIGFFFDTYFHTKPVFIVLFLAVGTVSSFYNLIKIAKKSSA